MELETINSKEATITGAQAVVSREVQAVQGAIISAKKFPRDQGLALKRIEDSCQRIKLAEQAMYSYSRGGSEITGPSIRLAEVMAQNWGNLDTGWRIIGEEPGASFVQAWAWDLETNNRKAIEFRVVHVRDTRKGSYTLTDQRDIYELVANQASRRQRNCILAIIPGDVQEAAIEACESTLRQSGTIEEKRSKLVAAFKGVEVSVEEIERRIGKKIAALTSTDYVQLQKVWKSLKDGMSEKADWFEPVLEPEKIKRTQEDAGTAEAAKLPHEAKAEEEKALHERNEAIKSFLEKANEYEDKGGVAKTTLKMEVGDVIKLPPARIRAATAILDKEIKAAEAAK